MDDLLLNINQVVELKLQGSGISILEAKNKCMLVYLQAMARFMEQRLRGTLDEESRQLMIKMRVMIDKIKPIESKIQYKIEKMLKSEEQEQDLQYKPQLDFTSDSEQEIYQPIKTARVKRKRVEQSEEFTDLMKELDKY